MKDSSAGAMNTDTSPVAIWEEKFKNDTLMSRDFREYWKLHVPKYFAPNERTNFLHITFDDAQTQLVFFDTLKQFILIENPADTIEHLKELTTPAALCGKVFKMGEATYSCRDCGQDSTCVLCRDCFKASVHQQHRYKMNQSVGGGYCDCGDAEAWREGASCEVHAHSTGSDSGGAASSLAQFPGEIVQRGRAVFAAALDYALEVLTHENTMDLPHDLRAPPETEVDDEDLLAGAPLFTTPLYATMFYNDETHTFEQVIECLRKAVDCSQRDAVDYATIIDRVGRSIVKCGDFQTCNTAKQVFDTHSTRLNNRPYKVQVMHTHVVAHQTFAMRLLLWLKKLIEEVDGFKALFAQIVNEPAADGPLLDRVMKGDTQLWKQARNQWHLLLIQGMLMENDSKKVFAKTFTRLYPNLMRDFMCDDHNHSDSVTSLSVQIYTVPTLAYMLITREDCLSVVTRTFYQECVTRRNAQDVLSFDPRSSDVTWRRINYCLNDLRYLLSVRPSEWDDQLRKGFLFGFNSLLDVLAVMEGMDASVRQTGSHLEYDPEWQTAFTLFGKLSMVICHLIDWCSSDRIVLIKAYRAVLRKLYGKLTPERLRPSCRMELPGRGWVPVIEFDMWSNSVSLHLPLTRMLAGLHLHLGRYGLTFNSSEFDIDNRPTIQQIVETSMRAVILTTQVRAGMWRRNGTSLVSQVHFYSNVRIRSEIQDRDIQILQIAASLMDPDEFIFTLMRRYGVHHWLSSQFEAILRSQSTDVDGDSLGTYYAQSIQEFTHNLEEFMLVLIHVFGERYQPGVGVVTKESCLKKEIIQSLCIEPTPHSKLCKLVIAENQDVSIEQLAEQVANFRTPSHNTGKGVYEIKPEFLSDYNPFWYHYTREEQSRAEGAQRRRKRLNNEPTCLPPPMLPPFTKEFHNARNIATCRAMVNVIYTVLQRATDLQTRVFSETLVHRTVFFMGMALNKEERDATLSTGCWGSCSGAAAASPTAPPADEPLDLSFRFSQMARDTGILQLLQELLLSARVSSHADLLGWVLGRLRQLLGGNHVGGGAVGTGGELPEDGREAVVGAAAAAAADDAAAALRRRRSVAAARRARILGQMQAQQNKFIKHNILNSTDDAAQMDAEVAVVSSPAAATAASEGGALVSGSELCGSSMDLTECAGATYDAEWPVCVGPRQTCRSVADDASPAGQFTCILCQATEPLVSAERPALVLAALVQPSTVLSRRRQWNQQQLQQLSSDAAAAASMLYLPSDLHRLPHISSCGHAMHAACWKRHFDSVCQRERRRALRLRHNTSFDVSKHEFLCPLCQCLSNTVIPLVPPRLPSPAVQSTAVDNLNVWISGLQLVCTHTVARMDETWPTSMEPTRVPYCSPSLKTVLKHMSPREGNQFRSQVQLGDRIPEMSNTTREMINTFSMVPFMVGMDTRVEFGDHRIALLTLQSAAYTLHAAEHQLRHSERPLLASLGSRTDICLRQLTRVCAAMLPTVSDLETGQESCVRLLRLLLLMPPSPPAAGDSAQLADEPQPTVLDMDTFGCLLLLSSTLTTLFCQHADDVRAPSGSLQELQCLRVCLLLHVVQVLLTVDAAAAPTAAVAMDTGDEDADERQWLAELYAMVRSAAGVPVASADPVRLLQLVRTAVTPFLRCCALYFHLLTGVRAPAELLQPLTLPQQLPVLLRYLGLDSLVVGQAIEPHSPVQQLVVRWCSHPKLKRQLLGQAGPLVQYPLSVNTLVPLPIDFSELINKVSDFSCPSSEGESRVPAMCLVCGELLCSQSYCCQVQADAIGQIGACNAHLVQCGAGVGLMLRIRECRVHLLVNKVRGANFPPPYVDKFGEVDQGLQRGNPLSLWLEQYERLNRLWMTHSIAEEVTRQMEDTYNQTDWQNL